MKINNQEPKERKINYLLTGVVVAVLSVLSIIFMNIYSGIYEEALSGYESFDSAYFQEYLGKFNYVLLNNTLEKPEDFASLTEQYLELQYIAKEQKDKVKKTFTEIMERWKGELISNAPSLQYYVKNNTTNKVSTNNELLREALDNSTLQKIQENYDFLAVVTYDEKGVPTIDYVKGATSDFLKDTLDHFILNRNYQVSDYFTQFTEWTEEEYKNYYETWVEREYYTYEEFREIVGEMGSDRYTETYQQYQEYGSTPLIKEVKNATFVYGIEKDTNYYDGILAYVQYELEQRYSGLSIACILIAMGLIALATLFIPYHYSKDMAAARVILRIPVEMLIGIGFGAVLVILFIGEEVFPRIMSGVIYESIYDMGLSASLSRKVTYVMGFGSVFLSMGVAVESMVLIKHIFHVGFFRYFRENILILRMCRALVRAIKNGIYRLTHIDFSNRGVRKLRTMIIVHTFITIFLCATWFFGIFFAVVYNVIVYVVIRNKYVKMQEDFNLLLRKTENIAEGNLDVSIEDELGIFNPVRDQINEIREGFKKAVEEEVKSQNMKTELISNVSHDLKTPLTSIITYVDLLKHGNLSEEQQKEYIDILERKAARLKVLIEDLFEMSKTASNNLNLTYMNINMVTLTKEVLVEFSDKLEEVNLTVKSEYATEKVICYLDNQKTYRILENLMGNIIKYAMPHTRVYVHVEKTESHAILTFKNISAHELDCEGNALLERFVRGDSSRNTEGSGLGLAIAKGLTQAQGGKISIDIDGDLFKVILVFELSNVVEEAMNSSTISEETVKEESPEESIGDEADWTKNFYTQTEVVSFPEDKEES